MEQKDLILFSMSRFSEWEAGFVNRNYHIYQQLLKQPEIRKIIIVDVPPTTLKRCIRIFFEDIFFFQIRKMRFSGIFTSVHEEVPGKVYRVSSILPFFSEILFVLRMRVLMSRLQVSRVILWSYVPTFVLAFVKLHGVFRVFDAVDDWTTHASHASARGRINANYEKITRSADVIFSVSEELAKRFADHSQAIWVPNGVEISDFTAPKFFHALDAIPTPRLCYVGVIQNRFDVQMVSTLATMRPGYHIVIAGWVWKEVDVALLQKLPNIHFLGRLPYSHIPSIMQQCQVGIVPHRNDALVQTMNPLKIYEYLAAGMPVVAANVTGFNGFSQFVQIVSSTEEFVHQIDRMIAQPPDRDAVRKSVGVAGWESRFHRMWQVIRQSLDEVRSEM